MTRLPDRPELLEQARELLTVRVEPGPFHQLPPGLLISLRPDERGGQLQPGIRILRLGANGGVELLDRFRGAARTVQENAEAEPRRGVAGREPDRLLKLLHRSTRIARQRERGSQPVMKCG